MTLKSLEFMAQSVPFETLPSEWNSFDLVRFSNGKELWSYQQDALKSALVILFKFYDEFQDYQPNEGPDTTNARRQKLYDWYADTVRFDVHKRERKELDSSPDNANSKLRQLLPDYYELDEKNPVIDFRDVCNRMSFWMATGSGKTIVLVKLLEILHILMLRAEIPNCDVLFLTHRDELLKQFLATVDEFNKDPRTPVHIELIELRRYSESKFTPPGGLLGRNNTLRVFYYRSDNLRDEQKETIIDFRKYDNHGRWYVMLDEAHKGVADDARRKHIVNILSRNGFLFNFSATFVEQIDITTTVHNFNLSEFINQGYGKHIAILNQDITAFKGKNIEDYSDEEKRKVVIKSMLLLAYTAKKVRDIRKLSDEGGLYHQPMLVTFVNSVNTVKADLQLYVEQVLAIGRGEVKASIWRQAKTELWDELKDSPKFLFEGESHPIFEKHDIENLTPEDVWRDVYNFESQRGSEIEVLLRPGNRREIAFKMRAGTHPFALINIGDNTEWLREKLQGISKIETLESESFFDRLNDSESPINILMGSRTFYEGWDSNRPNVINFINIGVGKDAKKFIMQSVGRGVRIQSWRGRHQRVEKLREHFSDRSQFLKLRDIATPPETLYVMGTNRGALETVLQEMKKIQPPDQGLLEFKLNPDARRHMLLVPEYKDQKQAKLLVEQTSPPKFEIASNDLDLLVSYSKSIPSDRVLLLHHGGTPKQIRHFRSSLKEPGRFYTGEANRAYRNLGVMVERVMGYYGIRISDIEGMRNLDMDEDIVHFHHITADSKHLKKLQEKVDQVLYSQTDEAEDEIRSIEKEVKQRDLGFREEIQMIATRMQDQGLISSAGYQDELTIEYLTNHYYNPVILSNEGNRIAYMKHIIEEDSETRFLSKLISYVQGDHVLKKLDWWMFSKLNEHTDKPSIPYYDSQHNQASNFFPDFIFWGQKGRDYTILFIDPKGIENINWIRKVDGYIRLFETDGAAKEFSHGDVRVSVRLAFFTDDKNRAPNIEHKRFWVDNLDDLFNVSFFNDALD